MTEKIVHVGPSPLRRLSYPAPHYGRPGKFGGSSPRKGKRRKKVSQREREAGAWDESRVSTLNVKLKRIQDKLYSGKLPVGVDLQYQATEHEIQREIAKIKGEEVPEPKMFIQDYIKRPKPSTKMVEHKKTESGTIWFSPENEKYYEQNGERWWEIRLAQPMKIANIKIE